MYPVEMDAGVERYNELLREAEEYRRALRCSVPTESWFSRVAKLFVRPNQTAPAAAISGRPVTSAR